MVYQLMFLLLLFFAVVHKSMPLWGTHDYAEVSSVVTRLLLVACVIAAVSGVLSYFLVTAGD